MSSPRGPSVAEPLQSPRTLLADFLPPPPSRDPASGLASPRAKYLSQDAAQNRLKVWNEFQYHMVAPKDVAPPAPQPEKRKKRAPRKRKAPSTADVRAASGPQSAWAAKVAHKLHEFMRHSHARVNDVFKKFDTDGSGGLDATELMGALTDLGIFDQLEVPDDQRAEMMHEVFDIFDEDDSGVVDFKEFNKQLRHGRFDQSGNEVQAEAVDRPKEANVHHIRKKEEWRALERFSEMDLDGSGDISIRELHAWFTSEGYDTVFVNDLIAALDVDHDGTLSAEEWRAGVTVLQGSQLLMSMTDPKEPPNKEVFSELFTPWNIRVNDVGGGFEHDRRRHLLTPAEAIVLGKKSRGCDIPHPELRAIQLCQLRALVKHVEKRSTKETWKDPDGRRVLTENVTHYDTHAYVIKPVTRERRCSFVEMVANEAQRPEWFVSYSWNEPLLNSFACLETHARDRGLDMTRAAYWVCAYAISPWRVSSDINGSDLGGSAFYKAMALTKGTLSIVSDRAKTMTRSWVCFETFHGLKRADEEGHAYDVYAACPHRLQGELVSAPKQQPKFLPGVRREHEKGVTAEEVFEVRSAVGLTDGLCRCDPNQQAKQLRESHFPIAALWMLLNSFCIETSEATVESDRVSILNATSQDRAMDAQPARSHPQFEAVNKFVNGKMATMSFTRCLDEGGNTLAKMLTNLEESPTTTLNIDLASRKRALPDNFPNRLLEMLPVAMTNLFLSIPATYSSLEEGRLRKLRNLQRLDLQGSVGLTQLPSDVCELPSLEFLILRGLKALASVPARVFDLRYLTTVDLTGCAALTEITARGALRCALTELTLEDCTGIEELSTALGVTLGGLQVLNLKGCSALKDCPKWVGQMEKQGVAVIRPDHLN